jgi:hypothetical protein
MMTTPSGQSFNVTGFAGADLEDLNQLDNRTANLWRRQGWLAPLYWHVGSLEQLGSYPVRLDGALRNGAKPGSGNDEVVHVRAE